MNMLGLLISVPPFVVWLLTALHVLVCLMLIVIVQVQRGRSGDLASAFGGGAQPVNMAAMSQEDFLTRGTKILATTFMVTSLALGLFAYGGQQKSAVDLIPDEPAPAGASAPAATDTSSEAGS